MASRKDEQIGDFFELRRGIEALAEFGSAALRFLDTHGIALNPKRTYTPRSEPSASPEVSAALRERVKRHYYTTRRQATVTNGSGAHVAKPAKKKKVGHPAKTMGWSDKRREARAYSAALLARLDRTEPRPLKNKRDWQHIGSLVRRGYARKKGDGYVATAKVFVSHDGDEGREDAQGNEITVKEAAARIGVTDSYVRLLVKQGTLKARSDMRVREGFKKPVKTVVFDPEAVNRYAAEREAATQDADA